MREGSREEPRPGRHDNHDNVNVVREICCLTGSTWSRLRWSGALASIERRRPNVILLDVMMRYERPRGARPDSRQPAYATIPVVLLTAKAQDQGPARGYRSAPTTTSPSRSRRARSSTGCLVLGQEARPERRRSLARRRGPARPALWRCSSPSKASRAPGSRRTCGTWSTCARPAATSSRRESREERPRSARARLLLGEEAIPLVPIAELLLYCADRAQHLAESCARAGRGTPRRLRCFSDSTSPIRATDAASISRRSARSTRTRGDLTRISRSCSTARSPRGSPRTQPGPSDRFEREQQRFTSAFAGLSGPRRRIAGTYCILKSTQR